MISPIQATMMGSKQAFRRACGWPRSAKACQAASRDVAVRRAYRRCVRNVSPCSTDRQQQSADLQAFLGKPSDGLEPSTPSLP